jgi:polysaccharide biosynthesis/export protein
MFVRLFYLILAAFALILSSCNFNSSIMLKTKKGFEYSTPPATYSPTYQISPNDLLDFRIFTNDGFKLIDITTLSEEGSGGQAMRAMRMSQEYIVEYDGKAKLPILGRTDIAGKTLREAELYLEGLYSEFYNKPFVLLNVVNRRVIVFPGQHGRATIVPLANNNVTLMEALALAGGISEVGKANKIKLIRRSIEKSDIYLIDLSTIDGLGQANLVLQANDIIYVEPRLRISQGVLGEITPIISLLTSALLLWRFSSLVF